MIGHEVDKEWVAVAIALVGAGACETSAPTENGLQLESGVANLQGQVADLQVTEEATQLLVDGGQATVPGGRSEGRSRGGRKEAGIAILLDQVLFV